MLLVGQVVSIGQLFHWLGYQRERCTEVVRYVGEEDEFGLGGPFQLLVEFLLLVALFLEQAVLAKQFALVAFALPEYVEQQEEYARYQHE